MKPRPARILIRNILVVAGVSAGLGVMGAAGEEEDEPLSLWELVGSDDWPVLYKSKKGLVKEWKLRGRFDHQYGYIDSEQGDADESQMRRIRIGTRIKFRDGWRLKVVANMLDEGNPTYGSLDSAYLGYYPSKHLKFKLGKQMAHFSQEWSTPSEDLDVIERSLLVQQLRPRKSSGFTMAGDKRRWDYELGVFSGDRDREFGQMDAGFFYLANIGYDFSKIFDYWKDFDLRFSYMHNDGDLGNNGVNPYDHSFSTSIKLRKKRFRLAAEALYANGIQGRADPWGFLITPSWELIDDKLDLVMRYHYAKSDGRDGLRLRPRYERYAPMLTDSGRGEEYQSVYLGLKYQLIEDRMVFMTGGEWSELQDEFGDGGQLEAFSFLTAMRFFF